jgi:predicted Zn-dependent protease with MMP-like domain
MMELSAEGFDALVTEELDDLADEIVAQLDNIVFVTEDMSPDGDMQLLGVYEGVALTERGQYGFGELPDRIVLFRLPLLSVCDTEVELRHEIHVTLVHEIAHFYGLTDDELHELGWA